MGLLRDADPLTDHERRVLLSDLASRLTALIRHLSAEGVPPSEFSTLKLIAAIEAGGAVTELWDRTLRVLDRFAAGTARRRLAFWKRG